MNHHRPDIDILMAVYNGERHLAAQLDSVIAQTVSNWRLRIRDDGSSDGSRAIIERYRRRRDIVMDVVTDSAGRMGAKSGFARLLDGSSARYVMCCDQDDIWIPEKIEKTLCEMHALEEKYGSDTPILVHTDVCIVDSALRPLNPSYWKSHHLNVEGGAKLNRLLTQNVAIGCTTMLNDALREQAAPIPEGAVMHDWWLALVAAVTGVVGRVDEPTVRYRQHGRNQMGTDSVGWRSMVHRLGRGSQVKTLMHRQQLQAQALGERFGQRLDPGMLRCLEVFAHLNRYGFFRRRFYRLRYGFWYGGFLRNLFRLILG